MNVVEHPGRPKIDRVSLSYDPLVIFTDYRQEVQIERGDSLKKVAKLVLKMSIPSFTKDDALQLAAYWFAMGERLKDDRLGDDEWTEHELRTDPKRRYLEE